MSEKNQHLNVSNNDSHHRATVKFVLNYSEDHIRLAPKPQDEAAAFTVDNLNLYFADKLVLQGINMRIPQDRITAFIGPSGCGKTTLLRCFNRMNDLYDQVRIQGKIDFGNMAVLEPSCEVSELRRNIGMVFQKPNPFPKSIYENIAYGLRIHGIRHKKVLHETVEWALRSAALFDEVKDRLKEPALSLSGGQQQRLVIARALAIKPQVLLLDEPTSALDPISTLKIEELIQQLKKDYTILIVTHDMQQAARVSDHTAFMYGGRLVEYDNTMRIFTTPAKRQTEAYITGKEQILP